MYKSPEIPEDMAKDAREGILSCETKKWREVFAWGYMRAIITSPTHEYSQDQIRAAFVALDEAIKEVS